MRKVCNPIISGFYPDPSICRVGDDYYLVNSSFAYFPGIPVFHSRDLEHWNQIGNAIDRTDQIKLDKCLVSQGIYAPTIRYHKGLFYIITTNVPDGGNFIVTAEDPAGPWSDAYMLGDAAPGIDPSLFFDEDDKCYYIGTRPNSEGEKYFGNWEIYIQEVDLTQMKLTGQSSSVWQGAMRNAYWPEGPHLYKKEGYYYILTAEGGTERNHSIMVARSKSILGPYEGDPKNPILTHRHLGKDYPVQCVGHGDLVQTQEEKWYMVMLGMRPCKGFTSLGRETFLAKVNWEEGWPVVNQGIGKLEEYVTFPDRLIEISNKVEKEVYGFRNGILTQNLVSLRGGLCAAELNERSGWVRLYAGSRSFSDICPVSMIGVRQKGYHYCVSTKMEFEPETEGEKAGLVLFQNEESNLMIYKKYHPEGDLLTVESKYGKCNSTMAQMLVHRGVLEIKFIAQEQKGELFFRYEGDREFHLLADNIDLCCYSTEAAGGFTGCILGVFVLGEANVKADFKHLIYETLVL